MKHIIDIKTWERKENYEFFLGFQNPTISITSEVECSGGSTTIFPMVHFCGVTLGYGWCAFLCSSTLLVL